MAFTTNIRTSSEILPHRVQPLGLFCSWATLGGAKRSIPYCGLGRGQSWLSATWLSLAYSLSFNRRRRKLRATNAWSNPQTADSGMLMGYPNRRMPLIRRKPRTTHSLPLTTLERAMVAVQIVYNAMSILHKASLILLIITQHARLKVVRVSTVIQLPFVWTLGLLIPTRTWALTLRLTSESKFERSLHAHHCTFAISRRY
jgi:hypothetical protein